MEQSESISMLLSLQSNFGKTRCSVDNRDKHRLRIVRLLLDSKPEKMCSETFFQHGQCGGKENKTCHLIRLFVKSFIYFISYSLFYHPIIICYMELCSLCMTIIQQQQCIARIQIHQLTLWLIQKQ